MIFYHAHLSTPNFDFDAYGEDPEHAAAALIDALRIHGKQYELAKSWYFPLLIDAVVTEVRTKEPYRDGFRIHLGKFGHAPDLVGRILRNGRVVWK
jgi:hypothetical protein